MIQAREYTGPDPRKIAKQDEPVIPWYGLSASKRFLRVDEDVNVRIRREHKNFLSSF